MNEYEEASDEDTDLLDVQIALTAISHNDPIFVSGADRDEQWDESDFEDSFDMVLENSVEIEGIVPLDDTCSTELEIETDQAEKMKFVRYSLPPFLLFRTALWMGRDDDHKVVEGFINDLIVMADDQ